MMNSGTTIHPAPGFPVRTADGVTVAELSGDLDLASAPVLREQLLRLLRPGASRLVLDLSRVTFCDASGLAVLVGASHRARVLEGFLRLAAVSPPAARVLQITGLHRHLSIYPTVHAATAAPVDGFGRAAALAAA
ncbi:MAG: STAS domain-containing protein [Streptosporangiaceae bacterium]